MWGRDKDRSERRDSHGETGKYAAKRKKQTAPPEPVAEPERYFPSPHEGLTREQVSLRREQGLWNRPVESPSKTVGQIVRSNVFTFFNLIFFILGACVIAVGSFKNLLFLLVVAANTLIGIIQEIRAKRVLDRPDAAHRSPGRPVVREGEILTVGTEELVLDDVVRFAPGNQICADAVVLEGAVQVNEALVTGEARPGHPNPATRCFRAALSPPEPVPPVWNGWGRTPTPPA